MTVPDAAHAALTTAVPGAEPDQVRDLARMMARLADELRHALGDGRRVSIDHEHWDGQAADAFRTQFAHAPKHLDQVATRYRDYATALQQHADDLSRLRSEFRTAQNALRHAVPRADAVARSRAALAALVPATAAEAAPAEEVASLLRRLADLQRQIFDRAQVCAKRLHHITDSDDLHNPHGWHHVTADIAGAAGFISTWTGVAGVVLVVCFPEFAPVLFAISAAASLANLGADVADKAAGDDVSLTDLGVDALGALPIGGLGASLRGGVRAVTYGIRSARTAEEGVEGISLALGLTGHQMRVAVRVSITDGPDAVRAGVSRIGQVGLGKAIVADWGSRVAAQSRTSNPDIVTSIDGAFDNPGERRLMHPIGTIRRAIASAPAVFGPTRLGLGVS